MSSGPQDSANTLYFNNVHYNNTTSPITSYHKSDLRASFVSNASNYQISINKLKISSLDGVQMGTIPVDTWQMGLEVEDQTTTSNKFKLGYVSLTGAQGIGEYDEYYSIPQTNGNVSLYKSNGVLQPSLQLTFIPLNNTNNPIIPQNSFYDYNKNKIWVVSVTGVYLYTMSGTLITQSVFANLVNSNYNVENGVLIVCNSDYENSDFTVILLTEIDGVISFNTISTNHGGFPLTNLQCADTDGTMIIVGYNGANVSTYNYSDRTSIVDFTMAGTTKITNILIDSANNKFTYINDEYIPYLMVANNNGGGKENPNYYDVLSGNEKVASENFISSVSVFDQYQFNAKFQISPPSGQTKLTTYLALTSYNNLEPTTSYSFFNNDSAPYLSVAIGTTTGTNAILMGIIYIADTDLNVWTSGQDATWTQEYTIPSSGLYSNLATDITTEPQIIQDPHTKCMYVSFGEQTGSPNNFKILKSTGIVSIKNTRPCFTYSGTWEIVNTNINVESMIVDTNYSNVFWALNDNIIYKGQLVNGNYLNFTQWYKNLASGQMWKYYITQPIKSSNYNPVQIINQCKLSDFQQIGTINSEGNNSNYTYIQQAIRKNLLYVVNNNVISQYDYTNLNFIKNINLLTHTGLMGQTTSYYIPPSNTSNVVYNMDQFITAFNNTFQNLFNLLNIGNVKVKSSPTISCDYTTKFATLIFDPNWSDLGFGIYVNSTLYKYLKFPAVLVSDTTSPFYGMYKYTLNQTGSITQNQFSLYMLNQIDKLLVLTNLPCLGDFQGTSVQTRIFTDLDLDTQDIFFTGSGNIIYEPQLLRKYDIISNTPINTIEYEFKIQYKDGTQKPYLIPVGENVSIKLEFDRVY